MRAPVTALATTIFTLSAASASALPSGIYVGLNPGVGGLTGEKLVVTEIANDVPNTDAAECCGALGPSIQLTTGFDIKGIVAPEFTFTAHFFRFSNNVGAAGMIGGGLRIFPVGLASLASDVKDFPVIFSLGGNLNYMYVGRHFAIDGLAFGWDFTTEYRVSEVVSIGARFNMVIPMLNNFMWTDYDNDVGRCLDSNGQMDPTQAPAPKSSLSCSGNGPSTLYLSPTLSVTFHFDIID